MSAIDEFKNNQEGLDSPANSAFAITPNDSSELTKVTRGVYVGVSGNGVFVMADGSEVTFTGLVGGQVYPFQIRQVKTATTATNLVGLL